ncbi:hypothetical protein BVIRIDIS_30620 [Blastochloris viridis]|uniref:DUF1178 family protein n=1 Tax=Blastochloris viridis TaxID=1079 RepID=A0A0S4Q7M6_BLAVI|nr:hypothetical protein BVIRIDIS_30620 [Blastochloris viridis]
MRCGKGHEFESWFPSFEAFEAQQQRRLVTCPLCGATEITKQLMAPSVARGGREAEPMSAEPVAPTALISPDDVELRTKLRALRTQLVENSDYVGPSFPDEARRMHAGEIGHRSIWGEATAADARALIEEGIEVMALPPILEDRN